MKAWIKIFLLSCILAVFSAAAFAQAPQTMNYQGRLADDAGNAITSTVNDVIFTIYDGPASGANPLWTETDTLECDDNGVFMIELGREVPIDPMVFNGEKRWLGIKVGSDDEMVPRQLLSSVPYSLNSFGPGVSYKTLPTANLFISLEGASPHSMDSVKINIPGPGFVYVSANTTVMLNHISGTRSEFYCILNDVDDNVSNYQGYGTSMIRIPAVYPSGVNWIPVSTNKLYTEDTPGEKTYYFVVYPISGYDASDYIYNLNMTAIYFPANYGAVSAKKGMTKISANQDDSEDPIGINGK